MAKTYHRQVVEDGPDVADVTDERILLEPDVIDAQQLHGEVFLEARQLVSRNIQFLGVEKQKVSSSISSVVGVNLRKQLRELIRKSLESHPSTATFRI